MTKTLGFFLVSIGLLTACGTSRRTESDSGVTAGGSGTAGLGGGSPVAGGGGSAGTTGGGGFGGMTTASGGSDGGRFPDSYPDGSTGEVPNCAPRLTSAPCTAEPCFRVVEFWLGCGESPIVDFAATSPTDVYFIVEASARPHAEDPRLEHHLFLIERQGEAFRIEQAPFEEGRCRIRALGEELFVVCTNASDSRAITELRFARRTDGEWHTEVLGPATAETSVLGFEVAPDGRVFVATGDESGARALHVAEPGGDFEVETLEVVPNLFSATMGLDAEASPHMTLRSSRET